MLIVCPSCASRYEIAASKLGAGGRKVRCPSCSFEWLAHGEGTRPVAALELGEEGEALDRTKVDTPPEPETPAIEAPVMRPDQSAEEFVEQEWARAATLDQAVSGAMAESAETPETAEAAREGDTPEAAPPVEAPVGKKAGSRKAKAAKRPSPSFGLILSRLFPGRILAGVFSPAGIIVTGTLVLALLVLQRQAAVRQVPQLAGVFRAIGLPVNLPGLAFEKIATELVEDGQGRFLIVQGEIRNVARGTVAVPPVEIVIQDNQVKSLYTWTAEPVRQRLEQGQAIPFRTRLASPPHNGSSVLLRFATGQTTAQSGR